ncbi:MAG: OmpA family protein, partial [Blastocatellia bacterium]
FLREGTKGGIQSSRIHYRGESGALYASESIPPDYNTPLPVLGARRSVEIAKREGAERYARPELEKAEVSLAALEQIWPPEREHEKKFGGMARDVMREAENARELTLRRSDEARLTAERQAARGAISSARTEAQVARNQAAAANERAEDYKQAVSRAQQEVDQAKQQVSAAQNEADRAKANEVLAKAQADEARLQAEQAKKDKEDAEQKLYVSLSAILATRREARGLVVSLSDVLFDFNKATLKPGAREKLSKLTGIFLAYPGPYHIEIDGYTDSVGSDEYNMRLSEDRANSVRAYLEQSGLSADRITGVKGYGKTLPVATNDTAEGRQMNRRVELVISDTQ